MRDRRKSPMHRDHLRRIAAKGGHAKAAKRRAKTQPIPPYTGTFLDFLHAVGRSGPTRAEWRIFWKAADGLPLEPDEITSFRRHTGRTTPPTAPAREVWVIAGRRAGKSENVTARATWRAISANWQERLAAGERGIIPIVAADKDQARNTLSYLKGLSHHPLVAPHVTRRLRDSVEFGSGCVVRVMTASWRSTRGYTMLDAVLEECAFYQVEGSANPDAELLAAVRPAMLTIPGARVYGISTPYARRGILFDAWQKHWGRDSDALVWVSDSLSLHPTLDAAEIQRAFEDDPAVAGAEYGRDGLVHFRSDVEAFISREAVEAVLVAGRLELPPVHGIKYVAFVDPSGGSQDSMTLAIAHVEDGVIILDLVREVRPPFSPEAVVAEFTATLDGYGIRMVYGDRYAGEWPRERFRERGITYTPSEKSKSELYVELLPLINAAKVELLDLPRLKAQLLSLERRVGRGTGRDSVDHGPGAHDDLCNSAAGALVSASGGKVGRKYKAWFSGLGDDIDPYGPGIHVG